MPSRFTHPVYTADVGRVSDGRPVRVVIKEFDYHVGELNSGDIITVPVGYCSDGASVPRIFNWIISPWGKYAQAAILHDLLYSTQARSKTDCDIIFQAAIRDIGRHLDTDEPTTKGKIASFWGRLGVWIGGGSSYRNGHDNYRKRAAKVHARALKKDQKKLAAQIILNPDDLPQNRGPNN